MNYKDEIFKMISAKTKKKFDENTPIKELDIDSIDMVEMISDLEEKFDILIDTNVINSVNNINDFINLFDKK